MLKFKSTIAGHAQISGINPVGTLTPVATAVKVLLDGKTPESDVKNSELEMSQFTEATQLLESLEFYILSAESKTEFDVYESCKHVLSSVGNVIRLWKTEAVQFALKSHFENGYTKSSHGEILLNSLFIELENLIVFILSIPNITLRWNKITSILFIQIINTISTLNKLRALGQLVGTESAPNFSLPKYPGTSESDHMIRPLPPK